MERNGFIIKTARNIEEEITTKVQSGRVLKWNNILHVINSVNQRCRSGSWELLILGGFLIFFKEEKEKWRKKIKKRKENVHRMD